MASPIRKRSIEIRGHKTSISLEDEFWAVLTEIARERNMPVSKLIETISCESRLGGFSSKLRVYVLQHALRKVNDNYNDAMH